MNTFLSRALGKLTAFSRDARWPRLALFIGIATACFSIAGAQAADSRVETGHLIALENCGRCHAIGRSGESALPEAPPFRRLRDRYPIDDLAEALAEGIVVGHKEMPPFAFEPPQIEALLAYLRSLGPRGKVR